jgi:hypothetical protein
MNKLQPIKITDSDTGKVYTLEFSRKSIERMERQGFVVSEAMGKPLTGITTLFHGAFYKNHPNITQDQTDKMLYDIPGEVKEQLFERLSGLYNEPIKALLGDDAEETERKNSKYTVEL